MMPMTLSEDRKAPENSAEDRPKCENDLRPMFEDTETDDEEQTEANYAEIDQFTVTLQQDSDPADGWLSGDKGVGNGSRVREDFEVDPKFSSTNTDFGGEDPAKVETKLEATFDPFQEENR